MFSVFGSVASQERARDGGEEYDEGMNYWDLLKKVRLDPFTKQAKPEEMENYRKEVEDAMIVNVRQAAIDLMEDWKGSHHESLWPQLQETCEELAEDRIGKIRMFFRMKRTGSPFPSLEELENFRSED